MHVHFIITISGTFYLDPQKLSTQILQAMTKINKYFPINIFKSSRTPPNHFLVWCDYITLGEKRTRTNLCIKFYEHMPHPNYLENNMYL